MGLSSLPAPSEGVLCVILVNTSLSLSIFKGLVRTFLQIVSIFLFSSSSSPPPPPSLSSPPSSADYRENHSESFEYSRNPSYTYIEEFRSRVPAIRYDSMCGCKEAAAGHDCSVCLSQFEPESEINHLACGHLFHQVCLEKWLDYWNTTCPLCRTPLMSEEDSTCFW
ncbi:hypothetical protein CsatA_016263 [Cannabis sativa]